MRRKPSEVRALIVSEHTDLRMLLASIEVRVSEPTRGGSQARAALRRELERFCDVFRMHIENEEALLAPILVDLDNWGPTRVEHMDLEHAEQRDRIAQLCALSPEVDPTDYVERIRRFCEDLRADMAAEELECLSPDVLRDDTINIDAFSG